METAKVTVQDVVDKFGLKVLTAMGLAREREVTVPDINRPALQLTGFYGHFDHRRIQIVGLAEHDFFVHKLDDAQKREAFRRLFETDIPCLIFCRDLHPDVAILEEAEKAGVPVLICAKPTSEFTAEIIRWLNVELAPSIRIHGVLVDVYGVGVLITGESGIGKSEAALELIKRGHRLVSDDAVEIHKVSNDTLVGTSPSVTQYFIELRGIGIVDVKTLFGVASVKDTQGIDMVIEFEEWERGKEYDRLGINEQYTEILGNSVTCYRIPIRPGRNLAIIVESAAANFRQRRMGYNAAQELYNRVQKNLSEGGTKA